MCVHIHKSLRANEEIAQVRAKAGSENMALTASLRKEQMKNESLEQALQQKVKLVPIMLQRKKCNVIRCQCRFYVPLLFLTESGD